MVYASISRINENMFTESDVKVILMHARENLQDTVLTEIGHLIAHSKRDQGIVNNIILDAYARAAFLVKYQGKEPSTFVLDGTCEWWFKRFLITQIKRSNSKEVKKTLGKKTKGIVREINTWFPSNQPNPKTYNFPSHYLLKDQYLINVESRLEMIVNFCARKVFSNTKSIFDGNTLRQSIKDLFTKLKINNKYEVDFLICICLIFHEKQHFFDELLIGTTKLFAGDEISVWFCTHPPKHAGYDISLCHPLIYSKVNPEEYLETSFLNLLKKNEIDDSKIEFSFDSTKTPKLSFYIKN